MTAFLEIHPDKKEEFFEYLDKYYLHHTVVTMLAFYYGLAPKPDEPHKDFVDRVAERHVLDICLSGTLLQRIIDKQATKETE